MDDRQGVTDNFVISNGYLFSGVQCVFYGKQNHYCIEKYKVAL